MTSHLPSVPLTRRHLLLSGAGALALASLPAGPAHAGGAADGASSAYGVAPDAALDWMRTVYDLVKGENLSPPAAARTYAYAALAMYEATVPGMRDHQSLASSLRGLTRPDPPRRETPLDHSAALVVASAAVLRGVLPMAAAGTAAALDEAERAALARRTAAGVGEGALAASVRWGGQVAESVGRWSRSDGHAGIVGREYVPPTGRPELWESTPPNFRPAIEPYWAEVRPMLLKRADEVRPEPPVPFSTAASSPFWAQAQATYRQSFVNTADHAAIARFWTDNPGSFTAPFGTPTGLPAGHWMLVGAQELRVRGADLALAVETLALTGLALHDAFLNCWTWKYRYRTLRPITYIRRYIDPAWSTLVNTPQFPEHTSGHSVASPAAAGVLRRMLGDRPFTDSTASDRGHAPRSYSSFAAAAREAADSRLYGGIHYPHGIETGLVQGEAVGRLVLARARTRR